MNNDLKTKIFTWLFRIFTYFVPGGIALYSFLIDKLIDSEVTTMQKIGCSGIFILILIGAIAIYFYGKHFRSATQKIENELLVCTDNELKKKLVAKKKKIESQQEMFHNACFLAPFVLMWILCVVIEKGVVSLRGTLMMVSISMATGFGFNGVVQFLKNKE